MPTSYITEAQLRATYGDAFIDEALANSGVALPEVLDTVHAEVDAYVSRQIALPPTPEAITQLRSAVAKLVAAQLYVQVPSEAITAGAAEARKYLENVAASRVQLHTAPLDVDADLDDALFVFSSAKRVISPRAR